MADSVKKYPKKLRNGETIMVDAQLKLWRKRMKKKGLVVGPKRAKQMAQDKQKWQDILEERAAKAAKMNFFGHEDE